MALYLVERLRPFERGIESDRKVVSDDKISP